MRAFIQNYIHNLQYAAASLAHPFEDKTKIKFTPGTWKTAFFNNRNKYECGQAVMIFMTKTLKQQGLMS